MKGKFHSILRKSRERVFGKRAGRKISGGTQLALTKREGTRAYKNGNLKCKRSADRGMAAKKERGEAQSKKMGEDNTFAKRETAVKEGREKRRTCPSG